MQIKTFDIKDLYYVLECGHSKELEKKFGVEKTEALFADVKDPQPQKINIQSRSFFSAITDGPSCSIVILWSIVGLVSLNVFALTLLTLSFALLLLITGATFFYATRRELNRENKKSAKVARLAELKLACVNEILRRQKVQLIKQNVSEDLLTRNLFIFNRHEEETKHLLPHLKKSIGATLMVTPILFGTYYFAGSGLLGAFGLVSLASAMTGPLGLGIAIALALALGLYFGYMIFKSCQHEEVYNRRLKKINRECDYKRKLCHEQRSRLQALALPKRVPNSKYKVVITPRRPSNAPIYSQILISLMHRPSDTHKKLKAVAGMYPLSQNKRV